MAVLSRGCIYSAEAVEVDYLSRNNIEDILQRHAEFDRCLWNEPAPLGMHAIMADINELKTTCKNSLCRPANRPSGKFRPGKLNSDWKTANTRKQMVKPVWISLNKSFAAAFLSLSLTLFLFPFFLLVSYMRVHLYICCILCESMRPHFISRA